MPKRVPKTPGAPVALGPYSAAVEANGFVFLSGQVALDPSTGEPEPGDVAAQTERIMENLKVVLAETGLTLEDVVKTTIFLADVADLPVVNGVYGGYFHHDPPARSTIQAAALPGGFLVEIDVVASRDY